MVFKNPKGGGSLGAIITAVIVVVVASVIPGGWLIYGLTGGIIGANGLDCEINIFWGCSGGGGGGGGATQQVQVNSPCTSPPNACGQTNNGSIVNNGDGTGSCNATTPDNSICPAPSVATGGFYATPSTVGSGDSSTLSWDAANATSCTITGDNGFNSAPGSGGSGEGPSGSISTGPLTQSTTFTLTCTDGNGGPSSSATARVIIDPHYKEI